MTTGMKLTMSKYLDSYVEYLDNIVNLLRRYVMLITTRINPKFQHLFLALKLQKMKFLMIIEKEKLL